MNVPSVVHRSRRAFLAPLWLGAAIALIGLSALFLLARSFETMTVIVIRHAEKQLGTIADPPLTTEGEARAERLALMFGEQGTGGRPITAVIASEARRAQQTAAPLARRLGIAVTTVPARDEPELLALLGRQPQGSAALVVGHSNTVPEIVAALTRGKVRPTVSDDDYGSMFIVTVPRYGPVSVLRMRY